MIKFLKIISNSVKSDLCMYFTYIVGSSSTSYGKSYNRFGSCRSIFYYISTSVFHCEKTVKFSYYSHFLTMNILKNAILNMKIFILRKFKPQKQSGIIKKLSKSPGKKSIFILRKNNIEFALKSQKTFINPKEKYIHSEN